MTGQGPLQLTAFYPTYWKQEIREFVAASVESSEATVEKTAVAKSAEGTATHRSSPNLPGRAYWLAFPRPCMHALARASRGSAAASRLHMGRRMHTRAPRRVSRTATHTWSHHLPQAAILGPDSGVSATRAG